MKLSFKNIIIIFLIALLGGACGTYGTLTINKYTNSETTNTSESANSITTEVLYSNQNEGSYAKAISKAIDTVVQISTKATSSTTNFFGQSTTSDATVLGSGVIISNDGYIVTNNHVVEGANEISVTLNNYDVYDATVIGTDSKTDLALIKIEASNLAYSNLVDSDTLELGQEVVAIGNSLGKGTSSTNGIISALNREVTINNYTMTLILTNAEVNSGNSGGGLFDMNGNLVGIVNAKIMSQTTSSSSTSVEGMGYAIPANTVKKIVDELMNNGYVKDRATLGVKVITNNSYLEYYGYSDTTGAVISEVVENGPAYKAGLEAGDIIIAINNDTVESFTDLSKELDNYAVGDVVTVTVNRNNKLKEFKVTLGENINE